MSVDIGKAKLPKRYVRRVLRALGGYVGIYLSALDKDGVLIEKELEKIEEGKVYDFHSMETSGIVKVKNIKKEIREEAGRKIYVFSIELQIIA